MDCPPMPWPACYARRHRSPNNPRHASARRPTGPRYGLQIAQRAVRVLVEQTGELVARRNCHGGTSLVLTRKGVVTLELHGVAVRHGLDLANVSGSTYAHFALTARWCLHKQAQGFEVRSEYALVMGQAPVSAQQLRSRLRKMPDAVLVKGTRLWLVETESAPKATAGRLSSACKVERYLIQAVRSSPSMPMAIR